MQKPKIKKMNIILNSLLFTFLSLLFTFPISAHVTVKPAEVGVGQRLNFAVSVPTEENNPTTSVRLVIPQGLQSVRPNVKPGWNVQIKRVGESMKGEVLNTGEKAPDPETVTEIIWSGGQIPAEMRDEFVFSAQAPAEETSLNWKAYQTYSDGAVVAWDADPKTVAEYEKNKGQAFFSGENNPNAGDDDHSAPKPYSITKVVNDLAGSPKPATAQALIQDDKESNLPLILSAIAVIISGFALGLTLRKR